MVLKKYSYRWLTPVLCLQNWKKESKYGSVIHLILECPQNQRPIVHTTPIYTTRVWTNWGEVFRFTRSQSGSKIICRWNGSSSTCEYIVNLWIVDRWPCDSTEKARWKSTNARRKTSWIREVEFWSESDDLESKGNMNDKGSKMRFCGTSILLLFWEANSIGLGIHVFENWCFVVKKSLEFRRKIYHSCFNHFGAIMFVFDK